MTAERALQTVPERTVRDLGDGMSEVTYHDLTPRQAKDLKALLDNEVYEDKRRRYDESAPPIVAITGKVKAGTLDSAPKGMPMPCRWVAESELSPKHRAFARKHVDAAAGMLGIAEPITIRWFVPVLDPADGDFVGMSGGEDQASAGFTTPEEPNTVHLHAGLRGDAFAAACVHEVRHVWQNHVIARLSDRLFKELDAERFAVAYMRDRP